MAKVTMNLSDRAVANADRILAIADTRTKTHAVEVALALAALILEKLASGAQVTVQDPSGERTAILIPGLLLTKGGERNDSKDKIINASIL
jgi:hypothetical protein